MTTKGFVDRLAKKGYYKYEVRQFVQDFFETLADCLNEDKYVSFNSYGRFTAKDIKPQRRIHPVTGEETMTKGCRKVLFSQGTFLREAVNGKMPESLEEFLAGYADEENIEDSEN